MIKKNLEQLCVKACLVVNILYIVGFNHRMRKKVSLLIVKSIGRLIFVLMRKTTQFIHYKCLNYNLMFNVVIIVSSTGTSIWRRPQLLKGSLFTQQSVRFTSNEKLCLEFLL